MKRLPWRGEVPPPKGARPTCVHCSSPLRPATEDIRERVETRNGWRIEAVAQRWTGLFGYGSAGSFCSKTCGWKWALRELARPADGADSDTREDADGDA